MERCISAFTGWLPKVDAVLVWKRSTLKLRLKNVNKSSVRDSPAYLFYTGLFVRLFDETSPNQTVGSLDLGGASTQIAYRPEANHFKVKQRSPTPELPELVNITLYSHNLSVYTQSLLCFGVNEMRRRLLANLAKVYNVFVDVWLTHRNVWDLDLFKTSLTFGKMSRKPIFLR